jgi:Transketolase, N-terminal subunit
MPDYEAVRRFAAEIRRDSIVMLCHADSGHPGGTLSCVELVAWLFMHEMNFSPENAKSPDRDRFVLSKGHGAPALYAALAGKGFFPKEEIKKLRHINSMLQAYPNILTTPGVEFNSGSLGQGLSFASGCALAAKRRGSDARSYVILGDGEMEEGQVWESLMFAAHYRLDNIVAIVDYNKRQSDDYVTAITALEPLSDKLRAFGWHVQEIGGHDFAGIGGALGRARAFKGAPSVIIAHTIKGKGISFMENVPKWHGSMAPQGEERVIALAECGCTEEL